MPIAAAAELAGVDQARTSSSAIAGTSPAAATRRSGASGTRSGARRAACRARRRDRARRCRPRSHPISVLPFAVDRACGERCMRARARLARAFVDRVPADRAAPAGLEHLDQDGRRRRHREGPGARSPPPTGGPAQGPPDEDSGWRRDPQGRKSATNARGPRCNLSLDRNGPSMLFHEARRSPLESQRSCIG